MPKYVFRDFSLISDLVHMCRANNECFQFQHSVSSLPAQSNLHFIIGNYFSNCFLKTFFQDDCGTLHSTLYIMDAFKTNWVHCKLQNALFAKSILEWGRKARRLFVKVLENFWNLQIHKNHRESQLRIILLSKNKRQTLAVIVLMGYIMYYFLP